MSNVQLENGYCSLATELVEQFCRYRLSGEEWLVLWAIFRKTYCWHKKEDKIALSQFSVMTGLKRQTVARALTKLSSKKIIDIIKKDDRQPNLYRFNKHFDTWLSLSKKDTLSSKKIMPVIKKDNELSSIKRHTIDTTKDTIQKKEIFSENTLLNQTWLNYKEMRNKIRKPMTKAAEKLALLKLGKEPVEMAIAILEQSIFNSWQGLFPVKGGVAGVKPTKEQEARQMIKDTGDSEIAFNRFLSKYGMDEAKKLLNIFNIF